MAANVFKAFEALVSEREGIRQRERKLVADLTAILGRLGYEVAPVPARAPGRRGTRRAKRRLAGAGAQAGSPVAARAVVSAAGPASQTGPKTKPRARRRTGPSALRAGARRTRGATQPSKASRRRG